MHRLFASLLGLAVLHGSATAQEASDSSRASDCRADARIAATRRPDSLYQSAVLMMQYCDVTGPPVLARLWVSATDSATLLLLAATTGHVRDVRLLDVVLRTLERSSASVKKRLAALQVLVRYYHKDRAVSEDDLLAPDQSGRFTWTYHFDTIPGARPLPADYKSTIAHVLKALSYGKGNEQVRNAASLVRRELYSNAPAGTPLVENAVELSHVCEDRFRLRNRDNIPLILRYRVGETSDSGRFIIEARPARAEYEEMHFTTKLTGTVSLWHFTTLLQTTANGGGKCD